MFSLVDFNLYIYVGDLTLLQERREREEEKEAREDGRTNDFVSLDF